MNRINAKVLALLSIVGLAVANPLHASYSVANGADLFVTGQGSIEFKDNIFLGNTGLRSDTVIDIAPGILITFGANAQTKGEFGYKETFNFYASNSGLNASLANTWLKVGSDDGKMTSNFGLSFSQANQANKDTAGNGFLTPRDLFNGSISGSVAVTEKSTVGAGFTYDSTEYKRSGYSNWKWWEIPVTYYYKTTPKIELGAGITYRNNELTSVGSDSTEMFYNLRSRGELTPKLTGEIAVGLRSRSPTVGSDQNSLGIESQLALAATEKTRLTLGLDNEYSYSGAGSAYRKLTLSGGADINFSAAVSAGASFSWAQYDYTNSIQSDDFYNGDIHGSYVLNSFVTLNGSYTYTRNDSNLAGSGFTSNSWKFGASLKY